MISATPAGPADHFRLPRTVSVADGTVNVGPTPQMNGPAARGDRKKVGLMSPSPMAELTADESRCCPTTGTIVRVMTFQSSLIWNGITGWIFTTSCVPL